MINTGIHRWSRCREQDSAKGSAPNMTSASQPFLPRLRDDCRSGLRKTVRVRGGGRILRNTLVWLYILTHNGCDSMCKTYASSSQTKITIWRGQMDRKSPSLLRSNCRLMASERWSLFCLIVWPLVGQPCSNRCLQYIGRIKTGFNFCFCFV